MAVCAGDRHVGSAAGMRTLKEVEGWLVAAAADDDAGQGVGGVAVVLREKKLLLVLVKRWYDVCTGHLQATFEKKMCNMTFESIAYQLLHI